MGAAEGVTKSQKRKKQPLLHLLAQKRKPATTLKASESSAPRGCFGPSLSRKKTRGSRLRLHASVPGTDQGGPGLQRPGAPGEGEAGRAPWGHPGCLDTGHCTCVMPHPPGRAGCGGPWERKRVSPSRGVRARVLADALYRQFFQGMFSPGLSQPLHPCFL